MKYILLIFIHSCLLSTLFAQDCFTPDAAIWQNTWSSCTTSSNPKTAYGNSHWLQYDLGVQRTLSKTWVWNTNDPNQLNTGANLVKIDYSLDGQNWTYFGEMNFPKAEGDAVYGGFAGPDLSDIEARYVLLTIMSNHGDPNCSGLSEMKFNLMPATMPAEASCAPPNRITAEEIYPFEVDLSWVNLGFSTYTVYIRPQGSISWDTYTTTEPETFIEDLEELTTYEVRLGVQCANELVTGAIMTFTTPSESTLAVEELFFTGESQEGQHFLCWKNEFTEPIETYEVQQSSEGYNFETIATLSPKRSGKRQTYTNTSPLSGDNYYRLKMNFDNEVYHFSNIIKLNFTPSTFDLTVHANPTTDLLNFTLDSNFEDLVNYSLSTTQGATIYRSVSTLEQGKTDFSIDVSALPEGVYFLNVLSINKRKQVSKKIVKVNRG